MANHTTAQQFQNQNWLVDSSGSHHVTTDLSNLSLHRDYEGPDDILIGDGSSLAITHTDSTTLNSLLIYLIFFVFPLFKTT